MRNIPWRDAIIQVLQKSENAMHYSDIAEKIVEDKLRTSVGATPAATVNVYISSSLNEEGTASPFIRVGKGEYFLRSKSQEEQKSSIEPIAGHTEPEENEQQTAIIHAFGMFWQRELVHWTNDPKLLGRQQIGADEVNFSSQLGVYLLHDGRDVVYVGRSIDRPLGKRLFEHTQDRLRGRWNRFSWFGLFKVTENGEIEKTPINPSIETIISTLEALLIEGLEPPQNRKRGDDFSAIEYLQAEDPEIKERQTIALLENLKQKILK